MDSNALLGQYPKAKSLSALRRKHKGVSSMSENREFSESNLPLKSDDYHGLANYVRTQPDVKSK